MNSSTCSLPLSFMSTQHVVVEVSLIITVLCMIMTIMLQVPPSASETCEYDAQGFTNYHNCHTVVSNNNDLQTIITVILW